MPAKRPRNDPDPDDPLAQQTGTTAIDSEPPQSFEAAVDELEDIVEKMESGELALEDSLRAYARGAVLVRYCRETLARVEQRVRVLEGEVLKPFELDAERGER